MGVNVNEPMNICKFSGNRMGRTFLFEMCHKTLEIPSG